MMSSMVPYSEEIIRDERYDDDGVCDFSSIMKRMRCQVLEQRFA